MKTSELIKALQQMPPEADVGYLWDGAVRSAVQVVYLSREGQVVLADYDNVVYHDDERPSSAPTEAEDPYWRTAESPEQAS